MDLKKLTKKQKVAFQKKFDAAVEKILKIEGIEKCKDALAMKKKGYYLLSEQRKDGLAIFLHKVVGKAVIKFDE